MFKRLSGALSGAPASTEQQQQQFQLGLGSPGNTFDQQQHHTMAMYANHAHPRPAALSTPTALSDTDTGNSMHAGYFGSSPAGSNSNASSNGGRSPGLAPGRSPIVSPLPSPNTMFATVRGNNGPRGTLAGVAYGGPTLPAGIDRQTLQKSLKSLETLLVALDEYRELANRMAKVEKRLAKNAKDLASNVVPDQGRKEGVAAGPQSTISTLQATSSLFESLSDVSIKHSKLIGKEYDGVNDVCSKFFKKIAKEEKAHDDMLENLDAKLKKANFAYDKRVRSSLPNSSTAKSSSYAAVGAAAAAHEQFVPVLSQLTDAMTKAKAEHAVSLAVKREACVKEVARTLAVLSDAEFRRSCDDVRKLGPLVGGILGLSALLGDKNDHTLPNDWPAPLPDSENFANPVLNQEPLEPPQPLFRQQNLGSRPSSAQSQSLRPGMYNSRRSSDAASVASRDGRDMPSPMHLPSGPSSRRPSYTAYSPAVEERNHSQAFEIAARAETFDNQATVTVRTAQSKPSIESSFRNAYGSPSSSQQAPSLPRRITEESLSEASLRDSVARQTSVQAGLQYHPSVSASIRDYQHHESRSNSHNQTRLHASRADDASRSASPPRSSREALADVTIPQGFVMDESDESPAQSKYNTSISDWRPREEFTNRQQSPKKLDLERSLSIESDISETSFVARMKAKYAQERESRAAANAITTPVSDVRPQPSPGSRVSNMAQRYEKHSQTSSGSSGGSAGNHTQGATETSVVSGYGRSERGYRSRASLPVIPSESMEFRDMNDSVPSKHQGMAESRPPKKDAEGHPSICGCEDCSAVGYSSYNVKESTKSPSRPPAQDTNIVSPRPSRRISMPAVMTGGY